MRGRLVVRVAVGHDEHGEPRGGRGEDQPDEPALEDGLEPLHGPQKNRRGAPAWPVRPVAVDRLDWVVAIAVPSTSEGDGGHPNAGCSDSPWVQGFAPTREHLHSPVLSLLTSRPPPFRGLNIVATPSPGAKPGKYISAMSAAFITGLEFGALVAAQIGPISLLLIRSVVRGGRVTVGIAMGTGAAVVDTGYAALGIAGAGPVLVHSGFRPILGILGAGGHRRARLPDTVVGVSRPDRRRDGGRGAESAPGVSDVARRDRLEPHDHRLVGGHLRGRVGRGRGPERG